VCGFYVLLVVAAPVGAGFINANRSDPRPLAVDLGARQQSVTLTTSDGIALDAAYLPSQNGAAVIVFPGTGSGRAEMLARHGYGVLLLDPRGQGDSEGDPNMLGWTGERDLRAAVDYLRARPDVEAERIGGLGLSVGGELMLQAAAHDDRLRAVVSEGAGIR
jgi:dipeptidyl aminopeptidase/acylaminoacyl peptidase